MTSDPQIRCIEVGVLYQLTSPSGKSYIGITRRTAALRFAEHIEGALTGEGRKNHLACAIRKYGASCFKIETLVVANDWAYLNDLEKKAIIVFGTRNPHGYNMTDGGDGALTDRAANFGELVSLAMARPEVAAKVKQCAQDRAATPGWREKISTSKTGKKIGPASEQRKERISAARILEWADPIMRQKRIDANRAARKPHVQINCLGCATIFFKPQWQAHQKFCSHPCFLKHRSEFK